MKFIFELLVEILIVALFLYSKLTPYEHQMDHKYKKVFILFKKIFHPILQTFKKLMKPAKVGSGLAIDITQIALLIILLILLKIF